MKTPAIFPVSLSLLLCASLPLSAQIGADGTGTVNGYKIGPGVDLSGADLAGADLSGADLSGANLSGADLDGADCSGADFSGASLLQANLAGASLFQADLTGADFFAVDFTGANIFQARLIAGDFRITEIFRSPAGMTLTWNSLPGRKYAVQHTTEVEGEWTDVAAGVRTKGGRISYTDSDARRAGLGKGWYRIDLESVFSDSADPKEAITEGLMSAEQALTLELITPADAFNAFNLNPDDALASGIVDPDTALEFGADPNAALLAGADPLAALIAGADVNDALLAGADRDAALDFLVKANTGANHLEDLGFSVDTLAGLKTLAGVNTFSDQDLAEAYSTEQLLASSEYGVDNAANAAFFGNVERASADQLDTVFSVDTLAGLTTNGVDTYSDQDLAAAYSTSQLLASSEYGVDTAANAAFFANIEGATAAELDTLFTVDTLAGLQSNGVDTYSDQDLAAAYSTSQLLASSEYGVDTAANAAFFANVERASADQLDTVFSVDTLAAAGAFSDAQFAGAYDTADLLASSTYGNNVDFLANVERASAAELDTVFSVDTLAGLTTNGADTYSDQDLAAAYSTSQLLASSEYGVDNAVNAGFFANVERASADQLDTVFSVDTLAGLTTNGVDTFSDQDLAAAYSTSQLLASSQYGVDNATNAAFFANIERATADQLDTVFSVDTLAGLKTSNGADTYSDADLAGAYTTSELLASSEYGRNADFLANTAGATAAELDTLFTVDTLAGLKTSNGADTYSDADLAGAYTTSELLASNTYGNNANFLANVEGASADQLQDAGFSVDQLAGLTKPDGRGTFSDTDLLGAFNVEALLASDTFKDDLSFLSEQGLNQELVAAGFADELYQQGLGAELLADVGVQALAEGISGAEGIAFNDFETIDTTVGFINENEEFDLDSLVGVFADKVLVNYARARELNLPAESKLGALVAAQRG
ncbi:MAG: pentapeptide repeat-containing protein [Verrucomicrobiales bacterium]